MYSNLMLQPLATLHSLGIMHLVKHIATSTVQFSAAAFGNVSPSMCNRLKGEMLYKRDVYKRQV